LKTASSLIYDFTEVMHLARNSDLTLAVPEGFVVKDPKRFLSETMDLTEYNNGNGVSFAELNEFIEFNKEALCARFPNNFSVDHMREMYDGIGDKMFLTHLRSIQGDVACVYGVVKDTYVLRILVASVFFVFFRA
jgi:hypothetical protein